MSKISLAPDASGSGIFTIASPNSNTNRTLTLPDDTGTIVTNSGNQAGSFTTLNTSGAVVFNDAGADVDFRVEGDTNAYLLFVDASTDFVGIGTNAPAARLHSETGLSSPALILQANTAASSSSGTGTTIRFRGNANAGSPWEIFRDNDVTGDLVVAQDVTGTRTERMRIDASGNLLVGRSGAVSIGQGVGIEVGEVGIDGVSGLAMHSAISIADDATITLSAGTGLLVFIEYLAYGIYPGAMFYCSYAGAVQLVSSSGGTFAATDSDGNACVFKGSNTNVVTVKNRLGGTVAYSIHTLHMRGQ
jgi:hypothetical protein